MSETIHLNFTDDEVAEEISAPPTPSLPKSVSVKRNLEGLFNPVKTRQTTPIPEPKKVTIKNPLYQKTPSPSLPEYEPSEVDDNTNFRFEKPVQSRDEQTREMLKRLHYFQSKGEKIRKFNPKSYDEVLEVLDEVQHRRKANSTIKFYKQMYYLMICGIEKGATWIGKGKIRLQDWSESVAANLDSMDDTFEDLYYEYDDLFEVSPIVKLAIMTIMSAWIYHQNAPPPDETEDEIINRLFDRIEANPLLMDQLMQRFQPPQPLPPTPVPRQPTPIIRRPQPQTMNPAMINNLEQQAAQYFNPPPTPPRAVVFSDEVPKNDSGIEAQYTTLTLNTGKPKRGRKKANSTPPESDMIAV